MKVLGVVGSRRTNGNTSTIVSEVLKGSKSHGASTEVLFLGNYNIKPCTGCEGCKDSFNCVINDDFQQIVSKLVESDGIILGSPTYWYNVSGDMKIFLDRCYSLIVFSKGNRDLWISLFEDKGKCGIPVAICEQHHESMMGYTFDTLKRVMEDLDIKVFNGIKGLGYFSKGESAKDKDIMEYSFNLGVKLVESIKLKKLSIG